MREALLSLVPGCGRRVEGAVAGALLMARIEEEARDLCAEFVHDARSEIASPGPTSARHSGSRRSLRSGDLAAGRASAPTRLRR